MVKQTLRSLLPGYWQCDLDVGEQFLNYPLHLDLREYSGVDVSGVRSLDQRDQDWEADQGPGPWECWERKWMGLRDSPYRSLQWQVHLKFEVYGDRKVLSNPCHWDRVEFNIPGSKGYRPDLPWVMRIRADGHMAAEIFVHMDDGHPTGHSTAHLGSRMSLRGRMLKEGRSGCVKEEDFADGDTRPLGRYSHPH
jgi:hypothetical protein